MTKKVLIFNRDGGVCQYCGKTVEFSNVKEWALDHILSKHHGGCNSKDNLRLSCWTCNSIKGPRDLEVFRKICAIKSTNYGEVITWEQAEKLRDLGVEINIPHFKFHFERVPQNEH